MAKQLSDTGIQAIKNNAKLYTAVAEALEIAPQTLHSKLYLKNRSRRFMEHKVIILIAEHLGVTAESLIVEKDAELV
jgi:hypothetical protein